MKKIITLLLIMCTVMTTIPTYAIDFTDFSSQHWAYDNVSQMVNRGVITGYPDGTFRPEDKVTRGEFCTMLVKAANLYVDTSIKGKHWSAPYVETMRQAGWNYDDWYLQEDTNLDTYINRSEATMGIQDVYLGYPVSYSYTDIGTMKSKYKDYSNFGAFEEPIYTVTKHNLMNGYEDGCFHPEYKITRAELCTILNRAFAAKVEENTSREEEEFLDVSMSTNSTVSKNVKKLKNAIIMNGQRATGGYGFKQSMGDASTSLVYLSESDVCMFSLTTKTTSGVVMETILYLYEDEIPALAIYADDELYLAANYSQPGEKINIIESNVSNTDDFIEIAEASYEVFDAFLGILEISYSDFKTINMSDFGIGL